MNITPFLGEQAVAGESSRYGGGRVENLVGFVGERCAFSHVFDEASVSIGPHHRCFHLPSFALR